ncbi:rhodanese-like domain-containing protein [Tenacibaculum sp. IB213877]|uniref:rhodanese-like domain-containing protein n=1 Tax=Tenacibaculum sp. IB213877 TaxID=3097351 RepID=UPI002A5ABF51|nr:rhodanese-like domain-containing protein [Tenacibaculum sp. IB213877]MDY0780995.1 rhodanese-like domain-containing protein [Tenacibaculum sp. IB213877]
MSIFKLLFGNLFQNPNVEVLTREDFKKAISKPKVQLVDVRSKGEYKTGHIKGAVNIDFYQPQNFRASFEKLDKNKPVYIYCRSGNRSRSASRIISKMGFEQIYDLQGGILNWK